jgi:hypothetical protein
MLILKVFLCAYNFRKWQEKHVFVFSGLLQNIKMTKNAFNKVAPPPPPSPRPNHSKFINYQFDKFITI